jgi:hypothetical protein
VARSATSAQVCWISLSFTRSATNPPGKRTV